MPSLIVVVVECARAFYPLGHFSSNSWATRLPGLCSTVSTSHTTFEWATRRSWLSGSHHQLQMYRHWGTSVVWTYQRRSVDYGQSPACKAASRSLRSQNCLPMASKQASTRFFPPGRLIQLQNLYKLCIGGHLVSSIRQLHYWLDRALCDLAVWRDHWAWLYLIMVISTMRFIQYSIRIS